MTSRFVINMLLKFKQFYLTEICFFFSDSPSENDDPIYDPRYVGSNDSESSDDSDESDDDHEYDHDSNIGFRSQRNSYYSSSNEALSSSARRTNPRLSMGNYRVDIKRFIIET